jgi:RNA polymerase sigma factor (sigma-70 family)
MDEPSNITSMTEKDREISEIIAEEGARLLNFIRRRVPDPSDVEDIVQEVFYELVEANRLLMPIDHVSGWLFRVARNRITDLFRKKKPDLQRRSGTRDRTATLRIEDLPSPDAGPEALYVRRVLLMSWNWRSTNCPTSNVKYSSLTNWRGAASKICRQKAA